MLGKQIVGRPAAGRDSMKDSSGQKSISVRVTDLTKSYDKTRLAVDIPELHVTPGEFLTLTGPSGCGKSTTLRMIAGLEYPTSGDVWLDGRRVTDVPVQKRNVALMFQNYALYPHMRVYANLEYGMKKHGVPTEVRRKKIKEISELLGITSLLQKRPSQLSGGEQQRVALGRAIIRDPDVLLLDEPLSNLDAQMRALLRTEIAKLQRQVGTTAVYVTHDQLEALTMSDRIAVMRGGRIEQVGSPEEIYGLPCNMFVAGFIGSPAMNFISGSITFEDDCTSVVTKAGRVRLPDQTSPRVASLGINSNVTLGVRPHHVRLASERDPGGGLRMLVTLVQLVGSDCQVTLEGDLGSLVARVDAASRLTAGDSVFCNFDPAGIQLFDTSSGTRL